MPLHPLLRNSVKDVALARDGSIGVTSFGKNVLNDHEKTAVKLVLLL